MQIEIGSNMLMEAEHLKLVCSCFTPEKQILYWGKEILDCTDDEFIAGLRNITKNMTV